MDSFHARVAPHAPLIVAVRLGNLAQVAASVEEDSSLLHRKLISGPDLHESCLELAARCHQVRIVDWLLRAGAAPTPETAPDVLAHAVAAKSLPLVAHWVRSGWDPLAPPTVRGGPAALEAALLAGWWEVLEDWKGRRLDWKRCTGEGDTVLHRAVDCFTSCGAAVLVVGPLGPAAAPKSSGTTAPRTIKALGWLMDRGASWDARNAAGRCAGDGLDPSVRAQADRLWAVKRARKDRAVLLRTTKTPPPPAASAAPRRRAL